MSHLSRKSVKKSGFPQHVESSPFEIRSKDVWETKHLRQMKFILDNCMDAVLKDIHNTPLLVCLP